MTNGRFDVKKGAASPPIMTQLPRGSEPMENIALQGIECAAIEETPAYLAGAGSSGVGRKPMC